VLMPIPYLSASVRITLDKYVLLTTNSINKGFNRPIMQELGLLERLYVSAQGIGCRR
jgi:hypothetical protein